MPYLSSAQGSLKIDVAAGSTLRIYSRSGTPTVTGSTVPAEDATATLGCLLYGPQTFNATITVSTTGVLEHEVVVGDPTPKGRLGDAFDLRLTARLTAVAAICESYERSARNNVRTNTATPSAVMAWAGTPAAGTIGYVNSGVLTTGYTLSFVAPTGTIVNGSPSNNASSVANPFRLYGAFPHSASGDGVQAAAVYSRTGSREPSGSGRLVFVTDEPKPLLELGGNSTKFLINYDDGTGRRRIFDSSLSGAEVARYSLVGGSAGGYGQVQLDFSQVGGRMRRVIEFIHTSDHAIKRVGITATSTYYEPPASPRVIHLTDSLGNTAPDAPMSECYGAALQDAFGIRDWILDAEGGTGYIADASGTKWTHLQKLQNLAKIPQYANPHMLVIQASVNDAPYTTAQKTAAMIECLTFAEINWPGTPVIALGPTAANTALSQTQSTDTDTALAAAVAAIGNPLVIHVPTMIGGFGLGISGTGTITTPNGTGNSEYFFKSADGTHFAGAGHLLWAERVAAHIASRLRVLLNTLI